MNSHQRRIKRRADERRAKVRTIAAQCEYVEESSWSVAVDSDGHATEIIRRREPDGKFVETRKGLN